MKTKSKNMGLEVSYNGNGQAVYYLGPGRTSGPFVFLQKGGKLQAGKKTGCPYGVMAGAALNTTLTY